MLQYLHNKHLFFLIWSVDVYFHVKIIDVNGKYYSNMSEEDSFDTQKG